MCQEYLQLLGPVNGAKVFSYNSTSRNCYLLETGDKSCTSISGPKIPSVDDCFGNTTTTSTLPTTTRVRIWLPEIIFENFYGVK